MSSVKLLLHYVMMAIYYVDIMYAPTIDFVNQTSNLWGESGISS